MVDATLDAVIAVDLSTGSRTILSDATTPDAANALNYLLGITLDSTNGRALVVDADLDAVVAIDLSSGNRVIISK